MSQIASQVYGSHGTDMRINPQLETPIDTFCSDNKLIEQVIHEIENDSSIKQRLREIARSMVEMYKAKN